MSKVFIEESTLTAIGDAIRAKEGSTALIAPGNMATKIANLPSGGGTSESEWEDLAVGMISSNGSGITSLPNGITKIRPYAFMFMDGLALTELPNSITEIGDYGFAGCEDMYLSKLPNNLEKIGEDAFTRVNFTSPLIIPAGLNTTLSTIFGESGNGYPKEIIFLGKPTNLNKTTFYGTKGVTIKVPWSEGEVANAPWGANTATVIYNYVHEEV